MATIFLSYRRTDSPQACRVYDWLVRRFGTDAVFMDDSAIPFAVNFPDFVGHAIASSKVLIALIGAEWPKKIRLADDPVKMEIETALAHNIPVLPVLIGSTLMPNAEELPPSISIITAQNAERIGVLHDFDTHMRGLLPKIESILGRLALESIVTADPAVISQACEGVVRFLSANFNGSIGGVWPNWSTIGADGFVNPPLAQSGVTLYLHRVVRLAELLELHFILSFWARDAHSEHMLAGWVLQQLDQMPLVPLAPTPYGSSPASALKIRRSDEDPRQIWKLVTDERLRLSLAYIATVSPAAA